MRLDQVALEDWVLASVAEPPIGESLEREPDALIASAPILARGSMTVPGVTEDEAAGFIAALDDL